MQLLYYSADVLKGIYSEEEKRSNIYTNARVFFVFFKVYAFVLFLKSPIMVTTHTFIWANAFTNYPTAKLCKMQ